MDKRIMELQPGYNMEYYLAEDVDSLQQELLAYRDMVDKLNSKCDGLEKENERSNKLLTDLLHTDKYIKRKVANKLREALTELADL